MNSHTLSLEALAAQQLQDELRNLGEDAEGLDSAVESQTDLKEALACALAELDELEALVAGAKAREAQVAARRQRHENRRERLRSVILAALEVSGVALPLRLPEATITIGKGKRKVIVTDETALLEKNYREKVVRTIDIKTVTELLECGLQVDGAVLSNASPILMVRRN